MNRSAGAVLTVPNVLTVGRLVLISFFVSAALSSQFDRALWLFVAAGITDIIDGFIARRFNQRSRIGAILDPAADKLMMTIGLIIFTFSSHVQTRLPVWLAFAMFARDVVIVIFVYLLYTRIRIRRFPPSIPGKISTFLQVVTLSFAIASNASLASSVSRYLAPLAQLTLLTTLYSGFDYLRRTDKMLKESA